MNAGSQSSSWPTLIRDNVALAYVHALAHLLQCPEVPPFVFSVAFKQLVSNHHHTEERSAKQAGQSKNGCTALAALSQAN